MGISISSKQKPKYLDGLEQEKGLSPNLKRQLHRSSSHYLKFSDSGYPTTPQSVDNSELFDNSDILSIEDCWIPARQNKSESKQNFFQDADPSTIFLDENEIFFSDAKDNDSFSALDIPGTVTSKDSIRTRERRRRAKTLSSSWTQSVNNSQDTLALDTNCKGQGKKSAYWDTTRDESSSDFESDVEKERRRRSTCTSNPKNRPGAARPRRRKVGAVHNSRYEGREKKADLCDYISSQIPEIADLLQENSSTIHGGSRRKTTRYELKVSVNPNSSVCEIILPGTFLFRSDSVTKKGSGHGLKRHKSLHLPRVKKEAET